MITIISFDQFQTNLREEFLEKAQGDPEFLVPMECDQCHGDGVVICCECDQDRTCIECEGEGSLSVPPSEYIPTKEDYYRQVFSDVVKYCRAIPGDFFENIARAISDLNQAFYGTNWRPRV